MQNEMMQACNAGQLLSLEEAARAIEAGQVLSIAGDEALLRQLPKGNWVGGTIPYFMGQDGGETTKTRVFVTRLPASAQQVQMIFYDAEHLPNVCREAPANGFSLIVIPAFSAVHTDFARHAPQYPEMYMKPLVGWVSGIDLNDAGVHKPLVVNGQTLAFSDTQAVVLHVALPEHMGARIETINLFEQGSGAAIRFDTTGFSASACTVDGKPMRLADYVEQAGIDTRLPLVANYAGAMVNVCISKVDAAQGEVSFYGPVFDGVEYRFAKPVGDYEQAFVALLPQGEPTIAWACNCVLNYLYLGLEGKRLPIMLGPMTFGEVAYQLLNQTMVYLCIDDFSV